jgi:hypothetical protein
MQWFPLAFFMIVFRHTVGLLWMSDQPVSETSTCTGQHNIETQETNIDALSGILMQHSKKNKTDLPTFSVHHKCKIFSNFGNIIY